MRKAAAHSRRELWFIFSRPRIDKKGYIVGGIPAEKELLIKKSEVAATIRSIRTEARQESAELGSFVLLPLRASKARAAQWQVIR